MRNSRGNGTAWPPCRPLPTPICSRKTSTSAAWTTSPRVSGPGGGRRGLEGAGGGKKGRWEIRENGAGARPHGAGRLLLGWQVAVALTTVTLRLMDPRTGGRQVCEPEPLPPPHCRCLPLPGDVLDDEDDEEYLVEEFGQPLALDSELGADTPAEAPPSKSPAPARKQQRPTYKGSCL